MKKHDAQLQFDTLAIEGGLFTAEWLGKVASFKAPGQSDADYGVRAGFSTREEIALAWRSAQHLWGQFKAARNQSGFDTWAVSQRFVTELLRQSFGFAMLRATEHPQEIDGRRYPVSHFAHGQAVPLVISACTEPKPLDTAHDRLGDNSGERLRRRSAFGLLQEYVNAADDALWGIASNGLLLRIARDNGSLTRPAWLEADLERLFEEENQAEFSLLWLLLHGSRFGEEGHVPQDCFLEQWRNSCREQGTRAREMLRNGVEQALEILGQGFVAHPSNTALRDALSKRPGDSGYLADRVFFLQLLRLVYRQIFLLTVEERGILHVPGSTASAIRIYEKGYSLRRLRSRAVRRSAHDRHYDVWEGVKRVWIGLAEGEPRLGLPALAGLFARDQCPHLDNAQLENRHFLAALFHLGWLREQNRVLTPVNWRDMGPEELGSIYESLLELSPQLSNDNRNFGFATEEEGRGNARKTTGSYYTPDPLVQQLLDSALEPLIAQKLAAHPIGAGAVSALLSVSIIDPACGSGHFLLAAARRLATHLARVQAEGGQPTPDDYRHALRQVVTHCIFGADVNPMAIELARMALWLEAYTPDAPLGFIDHHLVCGNSLIGIVDATDLLKGVPDDAYKVTGSDDGLACKQLKSSNKVERDSWIRLTSHGNQLRLGFDTDLSSSALTELDALPDDTLQALQVKRARFEALKGETNSGAGQRLATACDLYVSAFLALKMSTAMVPTTQAIANVWLGQHNDDELQIRAASLARQNRVLHWPIAFAQIFARGGFDCVIGNPPWEIVQARDAEIDAEQLAREKLWFGCGIYSVLSGRRDLYKLFLALAPKLLSPSGRGGFVLPVGFMFEDDCGDLRKALFDNGSVITILHIQNAQKQFFPEVHASYRFLAATFARERVATHRFSAVVKSPAELASPPWYEVPRQQLDAVLGEERSAVLFNNLAQANLHQMISSRLRRFPMLRYRVIAEFHASSDKPLLITRRDSDSDWTLLKNGSFHHFYPGFGPTEKFVRQSEIWDRLDRKELDARLWMTRPRLVFRDIARNDDSRTLIACLVPPGFVSTYDAPMVVPVDTEQQSELALAFYTGYLTSFLADFLIRPFVDKHIKGYVLARVPIPEFDPASPLMQRAAEISLALAQSSWQAYKAGQVPVAFDRTNSDRIQLDAIYLQLAEVTQAEAALLFDSFSSIQGEETRQHGEFRTAELVRSALARMNLANYSLGANQSQASTNGHQTPAQYSPIGVMRDEDDARLAGLVMILVRQASKLPRENLTLALAIAQMPSVSASVLQVDEVVRLVTYCKSHEASFLPDRLSRVQLMLRFFEDAGAIRIEQQGTRIVAVPDAPVLAGLIIESGTEEIAGVLLRAAHVSLERQAVDAPDVTSQPSTKQA